MNVACTALVLGVFLILAARAALAWTTPVYISGDSNTDCSVPSITTADDKVMVVFRRKNPDWRLLYRERSAGGMWSPIEIVSVPWSERPDIIQDPLGRPHVFYTGTGVGGEKVDLFEAYRSGGSWTVVPMTSTSDYNEDYPRVANDSSDRMHLVYTKSYNGDQGNVMYRVWNGSWSAPATLGNITDRCYYHRPDIAVDSAGNVHVVWLESAYSLVYRRYDGVNWTAKVTLGTTSQFFSYCKIAAASANNIAVVTFDQIDSNAGILSATSGNGGVSWSALQLINYGHYPNMASNGSGQVHLVYEWFPGADSIGYRNWNGATWSTAQHATPDTRWQGWPDVAIDASGAVHVVCDDDGTINYVCSTPDVTPPQPVTNFTASPSDSAVYLSWTNPSDLDFQGTIVRCSTSSYPTSPTGGSPVCSIAAAPGSTNGFNHTGRTNGVTYYYSAFAYDPVPNYSTRAISSATPRAMSCADAKQLAEGSPVQLVGKVITASFTATESYVYIEDQDRSSGMRVPTSQSGLAHGDVVNVSGVVMNRMLSGYVSERAISSATVTEVAVGSPLEPLAMNCRAVGGGPMGALVPGVMNGVGANNMGLLIRIAGQVTSVVGDYTYVDDGSNVENLYGLFTPKVGVMIRCPGAPGLSVGDVVSVAGIVEGSIPTGWMENRAYLRMRDWSDLVSY